MREIKFRAWDLLNNCWLLPKDNYPVQILGTQKTSKSEFVDTGNVFRLSYKVEKKHGFGMEENDAIICMFTGLLDKNGTEIWEGDIIKERECLSVIVWNEKGAYFHAKRGDIYSGYTLRGEVTRSEVIGNIYENPELLNNN